MTKAFIKKYLPEIIGALAGAAGGYLYWKLVGCQTGTCTIKSNWYLMVPWAAVVGYLAGSVAGDIIRKRKKPAGSEDN
jgi:hypothetical protein